MEVIFERTGNRRYAIRVLRPGLPPAIMDPAPGYDPFLPHDVMHMVVEAELGLTRAVFGQLAAGGLAGTFRIQSDISVSKREASRQKRRAKTRDESLHKEGLEDSAVSERATFLCWYEWLMQSDDPARRNTAKAMAGNTTHVKKTAPRTELGSLSAPVTDRICRHLDRLSSNWSGLAVGAEMIVHWPDLVITPTL